MTRNFLVVKNKYILRATGGVFKQRMLSNSTEQVSQWNLTTNRCLNTAKKYRLKNQNRVSIIRN